MDDNPIKLISGVIYYVRHFFWSKYIELPWNCTRLIFVQNNDWWIHVLILYMIKTSDNLIPNINIYKSTMTNIWSSISSVLHISYKYYIYNKVMKHNLWHHQETLIKIQRLMIIELPRSFPLAIRFVATSFIVLCEAPDDLILATKHDL